jgi:hypothetical protein
MPLQHQAWHECGSQLVAVCGSVPWAVVGVCGGCVYLGTGVLYTRVHWVVQGLYQCIFCGCQRMQGCAFLALT